VRILDNLSYSLKTLTAHMGGGAFATRADRTRGFFLIARELRECGYFVDHAKNLKPKHVSALVTRWKGAGLAAGTLKNRMAWLRRWAAETGKGGMIPASNAALSIEKRPQFKGNRAQFVRPDALAAVTDERVRLALRLQQAFGLRREEALKLRVSVADRENHLSLVASWCKGGRARSIPILHPGQRDLLDEVHRVCGHGSLIPDAWSYRQMVKFYDNATHRAGLKNLHGLRHWYAQWRYKSITGEAAPAAGGRKASDMTPAEAARARSARMQITRELGHGRLCVTDVYLGPQGKAPK
jgi:integrase